MNLFFEKMPHCGVSNVIIIIIRLTVIQFLGSDPRTQIILIVIEHVYWAFVTAAFYCPSSQSLEISLLAEKIQ